MLYKGLLDDLVGKKRMNRQSHLQLNWKKKIKYSVINLIEELKDLLTNHYKTLLKGTQDCAKTGHIVWAYN